MMFVAAPGRAPLRLPDSALRGIRPRPSPPSPARRTRPSPGFPARIAPMPTARTRPSFRPSVDRLETIRLLSGGVHAESVIDLKPTTVAVDLVRTVAANSPRTGRQSVVVSRLTADDSTNLITGQITEQHKFTIIGTVK